MCGSSGEGNALFDISLEALDAGVKQRLLLVGDVAENIDCLLGTIGLQYLLEMQKMEVTR